MRAPFRALSVLALAGALLAGRSALAAEPLDAPPFTLGAAALRALAPAPDEAHPVTVLLDEVTFTVDVAGRCETRYRVVFAAATQASAESWASLEHDWAPWYEERPAIRARVLTKDGREHLLDPATIAESLADEGENPELFSNRRVLRAPLPAMSAGVVVEQEILVRESRPYFAAGFVRRVSLGRGVPVRRARVVIDAPEALPLRTAVQPAGAARTARSAATGRVRHVFEAGPIAAIERIETGADVRQVASVAFSTAESWKAVAAEYERIVAAQIGDASLESLVRPLVGRADAPRAVAAKLLARLQRDVRYTGLEFDEASIVPRRPAETLKRRYGDCKDKAALLVAMLQTAGVPASVALLSTGFGPDVDPELPGLGVFDHAIVYVRVPEPFWIDPTSVYSRAGELPPADAGRLALVATSSTTGLVSTRDAEAKDSVTVETREFFLAESGPARVVETTDWSGSGEAGWREDFAGRTKKEMGERLADYVEGEYLAKGDPTFTASDPADLSRPFQLRLEVARAGRGSSDNDEALAVIFPSQITRSLPTVLTPEGDEEDEDAEADANAPRNARKRVHGYVFPTPFTTEWRYVVVPPPGFAPLAPPESGKSAVGTGSLTRELAVDPDGTVRATLRFETGPRRITAAQVESWRRDLEELGKARPLFVRFEQIGSAHLRAGRVRQALEEFRRLAALHPKEALHHTQIASALLHGGLGEAARQAARTAVRVEPGSAVAHRTLGWTLQHDLLGRRFKKGFDRAAALAAYRKAKELDPQDVVGRADLAILLEYDEEGRRYSKKADLPEAIAEYRALRTDLHEKRFDPNLVSAIVWTRDWNTLAETARGMERTDASTQALILAAAMREGVDAGIREAARLVVDQSGRRTAMQGVGGTLLTLREYDHALAFLGAAAAGAPNEAQIRGGLEALRRVKRREALPPPGDDPAGVVRRFLERIAAPDAPDDAMKALFTNRLRETWDTESKKVLSARKKLSSSPLPADVVLDLALAVLEFPVEGSEEAGWRVGLRGAAGEKAVNETLFVTREEGTCRIAGTTESLGAMGWEARRRIDAGDLAGARRWLDLLREEMRAPGPDDPYAGPAFARLWQRGKEADAARTRVAIAVLLAATKEDDASLATLESERARAADPQERDGLEHALAAVYVTRGRWKDAAEMAAALLERHPDSDTAFVWRVEGLWRSGRVDEARTVAEERRKRLPGDLAALRELAYVAQAAERYETWLELERAVLSNAKARAGDFNNAAWAALFLPGPFDRALDDARRGVELTKRASHHELHTFAAVLAEAERPGEARQAILEAIALNDDDEPAAEDWYVLGRIAELYGEAASAAEAYGKVERPKETATLGGSTYLLAQRRLAALKGAPPPQPSRPPARRG